DFTRSFHLGRPLSENRSSMAYSHILYPGKMSVESPECQPFTISRDHIVFTSTVSIAMSPRIFMFGGERMTCKFWLEPVELAVSHGFTARELNDIRAII